MKICSVRFSNLNSLRGEHSIKFDEPPLADSGVFLITGETGAGKTTILDAITVALYGKADRYDKGDHTELMARGTGECYAEVKFETGGKRYRSRWSLARAYKKPNGDLQKDKMELSELQAGSVKGVILTDKKKEVPAKVEELCGLNFKQFLRSVMLAQGKFAEFLTSNDNARGELLEKMTGTDEYTRISRAAFDKAKSANEALERLTSRLSDVRLLSEDEREAHNRTIAEKDDAKSAMEQTITQVRTAIQWANNIATLEQECSTRNASTEAVQRDEDAFASDRTRLEQHRLTAPFRTQLALVDKAASDVHALTTTLRETEATALPAARTARENAQNLSLERTTLHTKAKQELAEAQPIFDEILQLDNTIAAEAEQCASNRLKADAATAEAAQMREEVLRRIETVQKNRTKATEAADWLQTNASDKALDSALPLLRSEFSQTETVRTNHTTALEELETHEQKLNRATESIADCAAEHTKQEKAFEAATATMTDLQTKLQSTLGAMTHAELAESINACKDEGTRLGVQLELTKQITQKSEEMRDAEASKDQNGAAITALQTQHQTLTTHLQEAEKKQALARRVLDQSLLIAKYEDDRKRLHAGEPCPLCGSEHHPFAEHLPNANESNEKSNEEAILKEAEQTVKKLTKHISDVQAKISAAETEYKNTKATIARLQGEISAARKQFDELNAHHNTAYLVDAQAIETAQQAKHDEYIQIYDRKKTTDALQADIATERTNTDAVKDDLAKADTELQVATSLHTKLTDDTAELQARIHSASVAVERAITSLTGQLAAFGEQAPNSPEAAQTLVERLERRAARFAEQFVTDQHLRGEIETLQAGLAELTKTCEGKEQAAKQVTEELSEKEAHLNTRRAERTARFGTKQPSEERKRMEASVEATGKELEKARTALQEAEQTVRNLETTAEENKRRLLTLKSELESGLQDVRSAAKGNGFASLDELRAAILNDAEAAKLETRSKTLAEALLKEQTALREVETKLEAERGKRLLEESSVEEAESRLEAIVLEQQTLLKGIGAIQQILTDDEAHKREHATLAEECAAQRAEAARWQKLNDLIGSAQGDKFRKFAQGLTLARLVRLANVQLARLNERYELVRSADSDVHLVIRDNEQAGSIRPIESLSGGETFLVSLALALGLSDLASHATRIESLFVDEGFGTLDAQTLEEVMAALENLRTRGKTVGIISHVEMLKERITSQIQVRKQGDGVSLLAVVPKN